MEDEPADGVAVLGGAGSEIAGRAGAEGATVKYDGAGWNVQGGCEVGEGGRDVGEAVVFGGVSCTRDGMRGDGRG